MMLRKADLNYMNQQADGHEPDWRMAIMFETAKHINNDSFPYLTYFRNHGNVPGGTVFAALMQAVANDSSLTHNGSINHSSSHFKLIPRQSTIDQHPSTPWILHQRFPGDDEETHYCCDFYLNY